jgi:hypothetical protein
MSGVSGQSADRWWEEIRPQVVIVVYFCILLLALSLQNRVTDADFWWHLRTGQWILEQKRIPLVDPYSFTMQGQPWIAHSWLADVGMYVLYQYVGPFVLPLLRSLLHIAAFALLLKLVWDRWPRLGGALILILVAFVSSARFWLTRPNSLSLAFAIGLLYLWRQYKWHDRDRLWVFPPLMILWANLHSGYIFGFLLLGALFAGEALAGLGWSDPAPLDRKRWLRFGLYILLALPAVLVNPYGFHLLLYPFRYYVGGITLHTNFVGEWLSPDFHEPSNILFALLLLALIAAMAWRRKGIGPAETVALLLFVGLSLRSVRAAGMAIPLLAWSTAGVLGQGISPRASHGRGAWPSPSKNTLWVWHGGTLLVLLLLLAGIGYEYASWGATDGFLQEQAYPHQAVDAIETLPSNDRLFNSYNWGGYLIWRLYPERLVFIDGRADLYGDELFSEYLEVWKVDSTWSQILDRYQIGIVLCERQAPLATLLTESPSWDLVYDDEIASLFRRTP